MKGVKIMNEGIMYPKSIKKFLIDCWFYKEEEIADVLLADHYMVWVLGIDTLVDRTKEPEALVIHGEFETYTFNNDYKNTKNIEIKYKGEIRFFYLHLSEILARYFEGYPFKMRVIQIPDGLYYLEIQLDNRYSYVFQQLWILDDDERKELEKFSSAQFKEAKQLPFDDVFIKVSFGDDMAL